MKIEDLADKVNDILEKEENQTTDKRISKKISTRRIRDYISKGLIEKPYKNGKNIYFGLTHVENLVALRKIQNSGISESLSKKLREPNPNENKLQNEVLDLVNDFKSNTRSFSNENFSDKKVMSFSNSLLNNKYSKEINEYQKYKSKTWNEYSLYMEDSVLLKVANNTTINDVEKKEILKNIETILNAIKKGDKS